MGLFDALAEIALAPVKIAATATKTVVSTTVKAVQLDADGAAKAMEDGVDETAKALEDVVDAAEE